MFMLIVVFMLILSIYIYMCS